MKKLLFVFAAATLVFFSACRHDDFELLRHQVHIQGGANMHLGAPVGNGEMSIDDLFNMMDDPMIDSLMDTSSNIITVTFETSMHDTVSAGNISIGAKKAFGGLKVKDLPGGSTRVNRAWTPKRNSNGQRWSPRRSNRVQAAASGKYAPKPSGTPDNIISISDTVSYPFQLDMLTNSSFLNDADFELSNVSLRMNLTLDAICPENARQYLDNYLTFTVDSMLIFYYTEDGQVHQFDQYPFDGNMPPNVFGHDSPTGTGITQYTMHLSFDDYDINIAPIVNAKPTSLRVRFRYKIDVARSMVLDVVSRPEFDTTGFFLTGLNLNTITLDDVSNFDTASLMNDIRNNLANIDTLATLNYLFNSNIDTSDPMTVLNFLNVDTSDVLNYLNIDTAWPRTTMYNAGLVSDTTDGGLIHGAGLPVNSDGQGGWVVDTCSFLSMATENIVNGCNDTMGLVRAIFGNQAIHVENGDTLYDTTYFLGELTNGAITSLDSTNDILDWIGVDYSEDNIKNLLVDAGYLTLPDTSDEALMRAVFNNHYIGEGAPTSDTNWFINQATNGAITDLHDTTGIINAATNGAGIDNNGDIDTNYFISLAFGPGSIKPNGDVDTNYFIGMIVGPGVTMDDPEDILSHYNITTDTAQLAQHAGIPGLTSNPPDTAAAAAYLNLPYSNDPVEFSATLLANPNSFSDYGYTGAQITAMASNPSALQAAVDDIIGQMRQRIIDSIAENVTRWVEDTVETLISDELASTIEQPLADTIGNRITNYLENTLGDFIENHVETFVEDNLSEYFEQIISDTISTRLQNYLVPRIETYINEHVVPFVEDTILNYYKPIILDYLEERVLEYVTDKFNDTLQYVLNERISNFTGIKDTLESIMNQVSQAKFDVNGTVSVNVPFEMKINSFPYTMEMELWKDGGNPIDVEAILNKLPNFVDASLDDSYFNMKVSNGMPLEFRITAELLDANKATLATLIPGDTIKAAKTVIDSVNTTTGAWVASDTTISLIQATMNQAMLFKLKESKYVRLNLVLTSNNKPVAVKRDDKMAFRAYIQANANANVDLTVPHTPLPIPNIF